MDRTSKLLFIGSLLLGMGGWMQTLATWSAALAPNTISGLLMIVGGLIVNWLNKSPIKSGQ